MVLLIVPCLLVPRTLSLHPLPLAGPSRWGQSPLMTGDRWHVKPKPFGMTGVCVCAVCTCRGARSTRCDARGHRKYESSPVRGWMRLLFALLAHSTESNAASVTGAASTAGVCWMQHHNSNGRGDGGWSVVVATGPFGPQAPGGPGSSQDRHSPEQKQKA
jgi:hypothetical protein